MAKYFPIRSPAEMKAGYAEMANLYWRNGAVEADFVIPGDALQHLRVSFKDTEIIRVLDEMPLSTEGTEEDRNEGLVPHNFAYRVEDSYFWKTQSWAFRESFPNLEHYQFITGATCLDVLSGSPPLLMVVPSNAGPSWFSN